MEEATLSHLCKGLWKLTYGLLMVEKGLEF